LREFFDHLFDEVDIIDASNKRASAALSLRVAAVGTHCPIAVRLPTELVLLLNRVVRLEASVPVKVLGVVNATEVAHSSWENHEEVLTFRNLTVRGLAGRPAGHIPMEVDHDSRLLAWIIASWDLNCVLALGGAGHILHEHFFVDQTVI